MDHIGGQWPTRSQLRCDGETGPRDPSVSDAIPLLGVAVESPYVPGFGAGPTSQCDPFPSSSPWNANVLPGLIDVSHNLYGQQYGNHVTSQAGESHAHRQIPAEQPAHEPRQHGVELQTHHHTLPRGSIYQTRTYTGGKPSNEEVVGEDDGDESTLDERNEHRAGTSSAEARRGRILQRNRDAAARWRKRTQQLALTLQARVEELESEHDALVGDVSALQAEVQSLMLQCLDHSFCPSTDIMDRVTQLLQLTESSSTSTEIGYLG
jgi:hypothetical protein